MYHKRSCAYILSVYGSYQIIKYWNAAPLPRDSLPLLLGQAGDRLEGAGCPLQPGEGQVAASTIFKILRILRLFPYHRKSFCWCNYHVVYSNLTRMRSFQKLLKISKGFGHRVRYPSSGLPRKVQVEKSLWAWFFLIFRSLFDMLITLEIVDDFELLVRDWKILT